MEITKTIFILMGIVVGSTVAEAPVVKHQVGIRPSNVLGGSGQHASFSFVRPGLTQTSYAFNGPSSHQAFSSSIGNPHLAQKVLPSVAHALAYRNPGLGYFPSGQITTAYAPSAPIQGNSQVPSFQEAPVTQDQGQFQRATALAYLQQQYQQQYLQQQQYNQLQNSDNQATAEEAANYQAQLAAQYYALRQSQAQTPQFQQVPEQLQLQQQQQQQLQQLQQQQQQEQTKDLLGVAYSSAPSVAHVKVTGNGYNFDF